VLKPGLLRRKTSRPHRPKKRSGRSTICKVHQIELELQNEELRRAQAELDIARARYFDLYDLAPVGYCTISEQGLILEANLTVAALLGVARSELVKQPISRFILKKDEDIYYLHRKHPFCDQFGKLRASRWTAGVGTADGEH
jgi:PAS domain-containing protein